MVQGSPPSFTLIATGRPRAVSQKWPQAESGELKKKRKWEGAREAQGERSWKYRDPCKRECEHNTRDAQGHLGILLPIVGVTGTYRVRLM